MSGTLYRMIKTCHQDMDQDEHDIFQMFALSFHENDKKHSLFVDNKNGIYHLKHFPFLSFTLREKNELFYKLKNKYFGEKCTYTFDPTSGRKTARNIARNTHKTYKGGKISLISMIISIFTFAIVGLLFTKLDNSLEPNHVTGKDVEHALVQNLELFKSELSVSQSKLINKESKKKLTCSYGNIQHNPNDDLDCGVTLLNILKAKLEQSHRGNSKSIKTDKEIKLLKTTNDFLNDGEATDYGKYLEENLNWEKPENKNQKMLPPPEDKDDNKWSLFGSNKHSNEVDLDIYENTLDQLITFIDKNVDITQVDIANSVVGKAELQQIPVFKNNKHLNLDIIMEYFDKMLRPRTNIINQHIPKQREIFQLAVVAPILSSILSLLPYANKYAGGTTILTIITGILNTIYSGINVDNGNSYLAITFGMWSISHYIVKFLLSSTAIHFFPAYKYYEGSYIYKRNTQGKCRLQCVSDEFILHDQPSLHTKFLPGNIVSISTRNSDNYYECIVLAVYGKHNEKRLLIPYTESNVDMSLQDVFSARVEECSNGLVNILKNITDVRKVGDHIYNALGNQEQNVEYKGTLPQKVNNRRYVDIDQAYTQSIVFLYDKLYYRFDENENIICISDKPEEMKRIELMDEQLGLYNYRIDFGLYGDSYTYVIYNTNSHMYERKFLDFFYDEYIYGDSTFEWELETFQFCDPRYNFD